MPGALTYVSGNAPDGRRKSEARTGPALAINTMSLSQPSGKHAGGTWANHGSLGTSGNTGCVSGGTEDGLARLSFRAASITAAQFANMNLGMFWIGATLCPCS